MFQKIKNSFRLVRFVILALLLIFGWVSAGVYKIFFKGERAADSFTIESEIKDAQADTPHPGATSTTCASTFATACTSGCTSCTNSSTDDP